MDQNLVRRAAKARQQSVRRTKAKGKGNSDGKSLFEMIREDRQEARRRSRARLAAWRNGQRLLHTVLTYGVLVLNRNDEHFLHNVEDVKAAAYGQPDIVWETDNDGNFRIAKLRVA